MVSAALVFLLIICLVHLMIGLFVFLKNVNDRTNQLFFAFVISVICWLLTNYFSNDAGVGATALLLFNKSVFVFPALSAVLVLFFALKFTGLYPKTPVWQRWSAVLIAIVMTAVSASDMVVQGLTPGVDVAYEIVFGPASTAYFLYLLVFFSLMVVVFIFALKRATGAKRARLQYVVAGILASFLVAVVTNLLLPLVADNFAFVSIGPIATLFLVGGISYAIVKHRLFDIRMVVARSVAYVLLLMTVGATYGFSVFGVSQLLFPSRQVNGAQSVISIVIALLMMVTFQPLRRFFERITDRVFYRERYDSHEVLNDFTKILVTELDLNRILKLALTQLCESLHIEFAQIVVYNNDRVYRIEHYGPLPKRLMVVPELARLNRPMLIADEMKGGERKTLLERHGIRVSMTLRTHEEFTGYLLLGDKLSGSIYTSQDIELLEIVGKEMAVAIQNAKAYAEIEDFNRTLQARVDHATNRLRVANRHLKELDLAKDEFISMASHQLRTPLTTIKGYLSMMLEGDVGKLTAAQKEFVDYSYGASERMVNLISDLLNVSRLSAGRFLIQPKPTDMVHMVEEEMRQLSTHASAKNLSIVFDHADSLPLVDIDDNKTRQVIMNFIDNAIYYTTHGEVRITLEQSGDRVRLEVRDSGIGVPEDAKKKLFTKFFRAGNAQQIRPDGTGLGLYLAKRVVEDQGGTIIFNSVEGKGSTFGFELPIKTQAPTVHNKADKKDDGNVDKKPEETHAGHK